MSTSKITDLKFGNVANKLTYKCDIDFELEDLDGSLTGNEKSIVFFNNNSTIKIPNCKREQYSLKNAMTCSNTKGWIRFFFSPLKIETNNLVIISNSLNTIDLTATGKNRVKLQKLC